MYEQCDDKANNKDENKKVKKDNIDEQPLKTSFPLFKNQLGYLLPQII